MTSIYAVVIHDPENRGFEKVANDTARVLELAGFEPLWQSNEIPVHQEYVADPDFEVTVCYGGGRLESLSAFDETPSPPAEPELRERVRLASRALAAVREHIRPDYGDVSENQNPDAIATQVERAAFLHDSLLPVLDVWDEWANPIGEGTDGN